VSFVFRPAVRENVGLLIGLMGASGSGKTYTAMRLAKGIAGDAPFAVIDTEAGRAKHYADLFRFDHGDFAPPFSPSAYADAIAAADAAKYPVIVVDSFSHEHAGEGGILDMQEAEFQRMGAREAVKMASWIRPKMEHKRMVSRLLQVRAHLILAFRAEQKIDMVKEDGRIKVVQKQSPVSIGGWIPVCEKTLPFELTASFLLTPDQPGLPHPIKLQEQHRRLVPLDQPITEDTGTRLAEWAKGGAVEQKAQPTVQAEAGPRVLPGSAASGGVGRTDASSTDRAALITEIEHLTEGMPAREKLDLFATFFDGQRTGAAMQTEPIARVQALVGHLRAKAGKGSA
jgi:hypothetical protein